MMKRIKGRKRHIVVDTLGLIFNCFVTAANFPDVKAVTVLLEPILENFVRVEKVLADQGYRGEIREIIKQVYECIIEITEKLGDGFVVAPWRWVVERTFALARKCEKIVS